jgi:hypothetical protein
VPAARRLHHVPDHHRVPQHLRGHVGRRAAAGGRGLAAALQGALRQPEVPDLQPQLPA